MSDYTVERQGEVIVFTLSRPEVKNALTEEMVAALGDTLQEASGDLSVRCVVITGAGDAFCSGADTRQISGKQGVFDGASPPRTRHSYTHGVQRMTRSFYACEVPVIAAITGPAVGLGFDIALQSDIRIATPSAIFSEAFIHVGIVPGDGGFWYLPRAIGYSRALDMTVTGRRIDAATAEVWGLISEVVPSEKLLDRALALAADIASKPPHTVRLSKRLIRDATQCSLETALDLGALAQAVLTGSQDQREAVAATMERRRGTYIGA